MTNNIRALEDFNDFQKVFSVFESFPFFEKWTTEEVRQEYDLNMKDGKIFGYYEGDKCIGFISVRSQQPNEHPVHFDHQSKVLYISDIAVLPGSRRQGIGSQLMKYALDYASKEKYTFAYLRINENNPMAYGIAENFGFRKEYDLYEIVAMPHSKKHDRHNEEFRIFMSRKI